MIEHIIQEIINSDIRKTTYTEYEGFEFLKYAYNTFIIKYQGRNYITIVGIEKLRQYVEKHYKPQGVLFDEGRRDKFGKTTNRRN